MSQKKSTSNFIFLKLLIRLSRLTKQIKKEIRLLKTDKINLMIALILPPLIIWLFAAMSSASTSKTIPVKVIVVSYDSNTYVNQNNYSITTTWDNYTEKYLDAVEKSKFLDLVEFYDASDDKYAMETAREEMRNRKIEVIIEIPVEFSEFLSTGLPGIIECILDSSDIAYIQDKLNGIEDSIDIFVEDNNLDPQFVLMEHDEFSVPSNYNFRFNYSMITLFSFMVFGISMVLTILVVVQEKPIPRLLLTPVKKHEILLSKFITYTIVLALQIFLILTTAILNGLYLRNGLLGAVDLFIALFMLGFVGISLGMFISTVSKTKTEANQLFFAAFIVIVLLSGIFVPLESMPEYLQIVAFILPLSHGTPLISGILSKGKSFIGFDFFALLIVSAALILLSFLTIKRKRYEV
ncbi:MAG: ABC transporter permease [Promethearchaeota archaeon]